MIYSSFNNILQGLSTLFYPRLCEVCKRSLHQEEAVLCLHCNIKLPRTHFHSQPENAAALLFRGRLPVANTSTFLYFTKDGMTQHLLHQFKYSNKLKIGEMLAGLFAIELMECSWIKDIDMIVPVPLHPKKEKRRGFNQAVVLADNLGKHLNIETANHCLIRSKFTISQTKKTRLQRLENVAGVFAVPQSEKLHNKHILLIDDILTTGATLESCALEILKSEGARVSIVAIALAKD